MATPIVLKKPLRVYKVGTLTALGNFVSLFKDYVYHKCQAMPTVKINPEFIRCPPIFGPHDELWSYDNFYIYEGYHSYLTEKMAKCNRYEYDEIGIFEIPSGSTIYVNYELKEVVSTDIKYLELLKE